MREYATKKAVLQVNVIQNSEAGRGAGQHSDVIPRNAGEKGEKAFVSNCRFQVAIYDF